MTGNSGDNEGAEALLNSATSVPTLEKCHRCEPHTDISCISNFFTCGSWPWLRDEGAVSNVEHAERCTHKHTRAHSAFTPQGLI